MNFTGYQKKYFSPNVSCQNTVLVWSIDVSQWWQYSTYQPIIAVPHVLARSWGSTVDALTAVKSLFGCIPFFYHTNCLPLDTLKGVDATFRKMRTPESLYHSRRKRIAKRLQKTDPLFYDQMIDVALSTDEFDLAFYEKRQKEKQSMIMEESAKDQDLGHLWINPAGQWLTQFDWVAIRDELKKQAQKNDNVYEAWDVMTRKFKIWQ